MAAIEARGLTREYGSIRALVGLDLDVAPGEIYGLLGPNGAGKSTLVRILATLLLPTGGSARVGGVDVAEDPARVRPLIGLALQEAALDPNQTGRELLELQGRLYGLRRDEIRRRMGEVTELVGIGPAIDRRIGTYSGGMRRRLDLGAAIVHNPAILFLDEPTTGLDPDSRHRVWAEIERLNAELGMTILLTTQYLEEADRLAGRVGILRDGALIAEGPPGELKRSFGGEVVVVRLTDPDHVPDLTGLDGVGGVEVTDTGIICSVDDGASSLGPIAVALAEAGVAVDSIELRSPTLEEVFLRLTTEPGVDDDH